MTIYRLQSAYLPQGWARDALITVSEGMITAIETNAPPVPQSACAEQIEPLDGIVVPGMPNAHSHAFQRAMAGNAEYRTSARDSFWTWRRAMYALASRIGPEELQIVATQLFVEMLKSGYTSVAEFHYLHRAPGDPRHSGVNPMWEAVGNAARAAGIGLTFLPTLYQSSDFGGRPLKPEQARFFLDTDEFLRALDQRIGAERRESNRMLRTGAAFHSLRAVPLDHLRRAALELRSLDPSMPVHIHVAEQILEVRACERATGRRPIELLLDQELLTQHWCVVHATHATPGELAGLVAADAVVCVSISTEANLGDGFFDAARFVNMNGRLCVGSDSQSTVNPAEELRWLEYEAASAQKAPRRAGREVRASRRHPALARRCRERRTRARPARGPHRRRLPSGLAGAGRPSSFDGGSVRRCRVGSLAVRRRGPGDPRRHGRRPLGGKGRPPRLRTSACEPTLAGP